MSGAGGTVKKESGIDLTQGKIFSKLLAFILPIMAANLLQAFYNAADMIVVSLSGEQEAVGAIGTTGTLITLVFSICVSVSIGAKVVIARALGEGDDEAVKRAVRTAVVTGLLFGFLCMGIGLIVAKPALRLLGNKGRLLDLSVSYTRIYMYGVPFVSLTNFFTAIPHGEGNSKTPFVVLVISGLINVALNLFFVLVCKMTVDGVAQTDKTLTYKDGAVADLSSWDKVMKEIGMDASKYDMVSFTNVNNVITLSLKTKAPSATTVNITLINGNSQSTQTVEVGKYYSDYAAFNPAAQDGRTPESLKIESNNGTTRFVNVNTKTDSGKILATDTKVTIQWKAADRQIRFYTDSTLGKIYKTLTVYSGKAIGELPTEVNGKAVEYWTVWGSRIYTTTTYDWTADYVDAVPHFAGETGKVYLEVYVNGNRTSKYAQVDITHKLQDGVIYRDTLLDTIRSATKNNSLKLSSVSYLFNESEWSQYVRNVNNTTTNTKIQIGTDSQDARYVYVMVNGVTTKTTDPSNPKTGDSAKLGVAAAVLAVAVVGFGAVIVVNKKKGKI